MSAVNHQRLGPGTECVCISGNIGYLTSLMVHEHTYLQNTSTDQPRGFRQNSIVQIKDVLAYLTGPSGELYCTRQSLQMVQEDWWFLWVHGQKTFFETVLSSGNIGHTMTTYCGQTKRIT